MALTYGAKKVLVAIPIGMLEQCDFVAQAEHRTRSDLIRESIRNYTDKFRRKQAALDNGVSDVLPDFPRILPQ